jgi:hypothetical protein
MKTLLLFLLCAAPVFAQNGFTSEKGKIVWQHAFTGAEAELKAILGQQDKIKILDHAGATMSGQGQAVKNTADIASVRLKCDANFDFTVTAIEGGYVVKVSNYVFLEKYGPSQMRIVPNSLEKYYVEHGKIRNTPKTLGDLGFVDSFLTGIFSGAVQATDGAAIAAK